MARTPSAHLSLVMAAEQIIFTSGSASTSSSLSAILTPGYVCANCSALAASTSYTHLSVAPASINPLHIP